MTAIPPSSFLISSAFICNLPHSHARSEGSRFRGEERQVNRTELVTAVVAAVVVIAFVLIGLTNTGPMHNDTPLVLFTR